MFVGVSRQGSHKSIGFVPATSRQALSSLREGLSRWLGVVPASLSSWGSSQPLLGFFRPANLSVVDDSLRILGESANSGPAICQWCLG